MIEGSMARSLYIPGKCRGKKRRRTMATKAIHLPISPLHHGVAKYFKRLLLQSGLVVREDSRCVRSSGEESPEYGEQPRREGQEDVGDQQGREHVRPPVRPIQDQQVAAAMHKIKVKERTLFSAHNMVMFEIASCFAETCLMESHVRAGHSRAGPSREARSGSPRPIK